MDARLLPVVFALLVAAPARADIAAMPVEGVFIYPLFTFFTVVVIAMAARLLLVALKVLVEGRESVRGEGWGFGMAGKAAAIFALLVFGFSLFAYVSEQSLRKRRRGRREAMSNLGAIRGTQVAFVAEWGHYVGNQPLTPVTDRSGNADRVPWVTTTRFSILGFAPEGKVRCSYTLEGADYPTEAAGFTARAECDLDGDGSVSVWTINHAGTDILHSGGSF